jgi:predicted outer membrane repeat protein
MNLWATSIQVSDTISSNTIWAGIDTVNVTGDIFIAEGVNLTIDSGITVLFRGHFKIEVIGTLVAAGTKSDSICFTSSDHTIGWNRLRFASASNTSADTSKLIFCHFEYGNASGTFDNDGGAVWVECIYPIHKIIIKSCTFIHNSARNNGGAVFCNESNATIQNNKFIHNTSGHYGGAVYFSSLSGSTISNNLFHDNHATLFGGAISINYNNDLLYCNNNTVCNNSVGSTGQGGGIYIINSNVVFKNNIIYGNTIQQAEKNQVCIYTGVYPTKFINCDLEGGEEAVSGDDSIVCVNLIDEDPEFIGSGSNPFSIENTSPCANKGVSDVLQQTGNYDVIGSPRYMLGQIDIGAYEARVIFDTVPGKAIRFDGSSHYVSVRNDTSLNVTGDYTIEAWIKPSGFSHLAGIVSKYQTSNAKGVTLRLSRTAPYTGIEFNEQTTENGLLEKNKWYHIAAVCDSGVNRLYINGVEKNLNGSGYQSKSNNNPLTIGVDLLKSPRYFKGLIDEVRIWNIACSADDIRKSMYNSLMGTERGLVSYWQFNESTGASTADRAGHNTGALNNMDNIDWKSSTIPFGKGNSNSQIIASTGFVGFSNTNVDMYITNIESSNTVVATIIDSTPNVVPQICTTPFSSQYWEINKYDTANLVSSISFKINENLTQEDKAKPHYINLFRRNNNDDGLWIQYKSADSVDDVENRAIFNNIKDFGQFFIGKYHDTIPPVITCINPESWGILNYLDSLSIEFDENVIETSGKKIIIYDAATGSPVQTFILPSSSVLGSGTKHISILLNPSLVNGDYYVNIEEGAFTDIVNNNFAGILDSNYWKLSVLENGVITGNIKWRGNMAIYTDLTINNNLTIESGSHLKFMGYYKIENISGFYANGTKKDSIYFYAKDTKVGWKGLRMSGPGSISYCKFQNGNAKNNNDQAGFGGAIFINSQLDTLVSIEHSIFINNKADTDGGAIYCSMYSNPFILNNIFINNRAYGGGAISFDQQTNPKLVNNLFVYNRAENHGGAIYFAGQNSGQKIYNNTFYANHAGKGGAVSCIMQSSPEFINCIFYHDSAEIAGNEVNVSYYTYSPGVPDFSYCLLEGGTDSISGNYTGSYSNSINVDPIFKITGNKPFSLLKTSPCVDNGDPSTTADQVGNNDLSGDPRFLHGAIDMGAYETKMTLDAYAGTALEFDGVDDWVDCGNDSSLNITNCITIEAWIKPSAWKSHVWEGNIVAKEGSHKSGYMLRCGDGGRVNFNVGTGVWNELTTSIEDTLLLNHWNHIAATYDGQSQKLYINGNLVKEQATSGTIDTNNYSLMISTSPKYIDRTFIGKIDEVRLWKVARTVQQIRENMYLTIPENDSGLVSYWQFNAASGKWVADLVGVNRGEIYHATDNIWVNSTIPYGAGYSDTKIVTAAGIVNFQNTGTQLELIDYTGTDSITVTTIDTIPNAVPISGEKLTDNNYRVINKYGTGNIKADLKIKTKTITGYEQENPDCFLLFNRKNTSDSAWSLCRRASSANMQDSLIVFDTITSMGQFMVTKNNTDIIPGYALEFDTASGVVQLAHEEQFDFDTAFTLEAWIFVDSMNTEYQTIISKGNVWKLRMIYSNDAVMFEFSISSGGGQVSTTYLTDTSTVLNKWNHISCVYSNVYPDYSMVIYLNGIAGDVVSSANLNQNNEPVTIGSLFKGKLDELRFWRLARTVEQIREKMHLSLKYPMTGLVTNLQLNEGMGNITKDMYADNYGTLQNFVQPAGWIISPIPFGAGFSNTQNAEPGNVVFPETGVSIDFTNQTHASVTVSRIDSMPNVLPTGCNDILVNNYWDIHCYGKETFNAHISFLVDEPLTEDDFNNPGVIKLYSRGVNSTANWTLAALASSVNTDSNTVLFKGINEPGQFIVVRDKKFSGLPGNAIAFDGVDDYIAGYGINTFLPAFTIEMWVKHDTLPEEVQRYFTLEPDVAVLAYNGSFFGGYHELDFYLKKASGHMKSIRVDSILSPDKWFYIAATYDGSIMKLYLNGELLQSKPIETTLYPFNGEFTFSHFKETLNGKLDELRIWNSARTSKQIREEMHRVINRSEKNLVYYWQFNDNTPVGITDTVNGLFGRFQNMEIANCRVKSTIPAGLGVSNTKIVSITGSLGFAGTDVKMNFTQKQGTDSVSTTLIKVGPNIYPPEKYQSFNSQYWAINSFGAKNFNTDITFTPNDSLLPSDQIYLSSIKLFHRNSTSDSLWEIVDSASAINMTDNSITFADISQFGQFIIAKEINYPPGNCLEFDGIDDYVSVPKSDSLNKNRFTVEFWVRTLNPAPNAGIIDKGCDSQNNWYFLTGNGADSNGVVFGIGQGSNPPAQLTHSWNDNNWHHVAGTYNNNTMKLYVDGLLTDSVVATISLFDNEIHMGNKLTNSAYFRGKLDDVRIWNFARSVEQIRNDMHKELTGLENNLISYWTFNESSGDTAIDLSSNYNGVLNNMNAASWDESTAPLPYFTINNGNWELDTTWAEGQKHPVNKWSRVRVMNNIIISDNIEIIELKIATNAALILTGNARLKLAK